ALPRGEAARLAASGRLPAPADVLLVRAHPGTKRDPALQVRVLREQEAPEGVELAAGERPRDASGAFAVPLLLVFGPGDTPAFAGLEVLAVDDPDAEGGFAPWLELRGPAGK